MGPGVFGVEAAARKYFGKPAAKLSRAEAAMIIASLPNPKKFLPKPMSRRVAWRYPQILKQMQNIEDDEELQQLLKSK
jgi:monofunctional biosynthetic peptidoglycan transglycosylase